MKIWITILVVVVVIAASVVQTMAFNADDIERIRQAGLVVWGSLAGIASFIWTIIQHFTKKDK